MGLLFLAFTLLPFAELFVLVRIGRVIGPWYTILGVIAVGIVGAVLARHQGKRVIREWRSSLTEGRVPEDGVLGGLLVLVGAILLITPGVITDVLGLALLLPVTRRALTRVLRHHLERQLLSGTVRLSTYGFDWSGANVHDVPLRSSRSVRSAPKDAGPHRRSDVIDTEGEEV